MDDFNTFKAAREKMDPSSRKMSDQQWQQAYTAYRSARERVGGGAQSENKSSSKAKKRRHSNASSQRTGNRKENAKLSRRGAHRPNNASELVTLRHEIRGQSAYSDLRIIVDVMAWVAAGVVVLAGVFTLFYYTSVPVTLTSLLGTLVQVIGIIVARLLVQVLIDIPDIALYRTQRELHQSQPSTQD